MPANLKRKHSASPQGPPLATGSADAGTFTAAVEQPYVPPLLIHQQLNPPILPADAHLAQGMLVKRQRIHTQQQIQVQQQLLVQPQLQPQYQLTMCYQAPPAQQIPLWHPGTIQQQMQQQTQQQQQQQQQIHAQQYVPFQHPPPMQAQTLESRQTSIELQIERLEQRKIWRQNQMNVLRWEEAQDFNRGMQLRFEMQTISMQAQRPSRRSSM
ncbi:hypothetical protein K461DRAFT_296919 [Myriangium duriaei CBS 260.36]|uniref:Uncharacterized protein n=1 Tax=Myriangium duriaei CBS 260.36 TaxID=1168546 RepID=A0A9P4ISZ7_9PEZI|nr:hypothetical protein K461DRAFT_296919 [Myriangium duriaei CBS 260.36]